MVYYIENNFSTVYIETHLAPRFLGKGYKTVLLLKKT